jgi:preprotein translocase subunit SecF
VLRAFGFTMVVGVLVGTYSTIFIATPLVLWWSVVSQRRRPPAIKAAL